MEKETVQEKYLKQRVEKPESEQQNKTNEDEKKANEDEPSKVQKQDLDHVENTLNEEVNQEYMKSC